MTVLYMPVRIESVEQAEALPIGTLARDPFPSLEDVGERDVAQFAGNGMWLSGGTAWTHRYVIGWTALVSIEVEEEWAARFDSGEMYMNLDEDSARNADGGAAMSRLVTPWEEVSDKP